MVSNRILWDSVDLIYVRMSVMDICYRIQFHDLEIIVL